jgi:D-alanyl-D-alanine endopeptidase (penicillin-binding protein 7)
MPEAPEHLFPRRTFGLRLRAALQSAAVALCATAFLLPAAQASTTHVKPKTGVHAKKSVAPAGRKAASVSEGRGERKAAVASRAGGKARVARGESSRRLARAEASERTERGGSKMVVTLRNRHGRMVAVTQRRSLMRVAYEPPVAMAPESFGQMAGLEATADPLKLRSNAALVIDQDTNEVLFRKNDEAVLPIASLTKLMTGLLVSEAHLPMDEMITITQDDVDTLKHSSSRLRVGTTLSRGEMLHLALMSSENRAAHALARTYPGGLATFVSVMNAKARMLGMRDTHYEEPTGLSFHNQSTAHDLALLVNAASADPLVREYTTSPEHQVEVGNRVMQFNTTNSLVRSPDWDIVVQKTGFINEAGQCMVMQTKIAGRKLIMVFLDGTGHLARITDAERVRHWVEATHFTPMAMGQRTGAQVASGV